MDPELQPDEFRCAVCRNVYRKAWSDEEALAEAESVFTPAELQDAAPVCDDCWDYGVRKGLLPPAAAR
jgi:hypothetical protein